MNRIYDNSTIMLIIVLIVLSCNENDGLDMYKYDGKIWFTFINDTTSTNTDMYILKMRTKEQFNNIPNHLVTESDISENSIKIHILEIDESKAIYHAFGPANTDISFQLVNENYILKFYNGTGVNEHIISTINDSVSVIVGDTSFSQFYQYADINWW